VDLRIREVALVRLRACGEEERVIEPPHHEERRALVSKVGVELRIQCDVARVVAK
jgi:hypothetical protein